MRSLQDYIYESSAKTAYDGEGFFFDNTEFYKKIGYKYYNKETGAPSLEDIQKAYFTTNNVTGDPSFCDFDDKSYTKIKKNTWQYMPTQASAIGGTITDEKLFDMISKADKWFFMLRFTDEK